MLYMVTCTIHIPQMLAYTPYMDPMGLQFQYADLFPFGMSQNLLLP